MTSEILVTTGGRAAYCYAAHAQDVAGFVDGTGVHEETHVYALLDMAQQTAVAGRVAKVIAGLPQARLFQGRFANGVASLSPLLAQLPRSRAAHAHIEALSRACEDWPMLSFVASTLSLDALARSLQALLVIETESGQGYLLRIADTLAMRAALQAATPGQRACMLDGVLAWWTTDTGGQLSELRAAFAVGDPADSRLPLRYTAEQMDVLLDASLVPIIAAQLRTLDPAFAGWRWAQQHDFVTRMATRASNAGFTTDAEVLAWCQAALRGGDRYDEHPLASMALLEARSEPAPQRLSTALASLDDDSWSEIRGWAERDQPVMP